MKAPMTTDEFLEMISLENDQDKDAYLDKICEREMERLKAERRQLENKGQHNSKMELFDKLVECSTKKEFLELVPKVFPSMAEAEKQRLMKELQLQ